MGCEDSKLLQLELKNNENLRAKKGKKLTRRGGMNLDCQIIEEHRNENDKLTPEEELYLEQFLKNHFLFHKINIDLIQHLTPKFQCLQIQVNNRIYSKGEPSIYFYILRKGAVIIKQRGQPLNDKIINEGSSFGDQEIRFKCNRLATAESLEAVTVYRLKKNILIKILQEISKKNQNETYKQIKACQSFKHLSNKNKQKLAQFGLQLRYPKDFLLFEKGQVSHCLFLIKSGKILLKTGEKQPLQVYPKECFGQGCVSQHQTFRMANAQCIQPTILLCFNRIDMMKIIGNDVIQMQITNRLSWAIKYDKYLKLLPLVTDSLLEMRQVLIYLDGQLIAERGTPINHFIISLQGKINDEVELKVVNSQYLLDFKYHTNNLIKKGNGRVALLSITQLQDKFQRKIESLLEFDYTILRQAEIIRRMTAYAMNINLNNLFVIQKLKQHENTMSLHVKNDCNIQFMILSIRNNPEGSLLESQKKYEIGVRISHNLISRYYRYYQHNNHSFFLGRWVQGQNLLDYVLREKKLSANLVRHFAACIISQAEYLLSIGLIWKTMEIDTFTIDSQGYLILSDLRNVELKRTGDEISVLFINSNPNYNEKDIYEEYDIDYWSFGQLLYRMLIGNSTIEDDEERKIKEKLDESKKSKISEADDKGREGVVNLPSWLNSDIKSFLKLLLGMNKMVNKNGFTVSKLKNTALLKQYDWHALNSKKIKNIPINQIRYQKDISSSTKLLQYINFDKKQQA